MNSASQIDKAKSLLIAAFKTVLDGKASELILVKPKVGLRLNVPEKDIRIIDKPQVIPHDITQGREKVMGKWSHRACGNSPACAVPDNCSSD